MARKDVQLDHKTILDLIHEQSTVLDLGCGTGTLTVMGKQAVPNAEVIGLDGDSNVLAIARAKAEQVGARKGQVHL